MVLKIVHSHERIAHDDLTVLNVLRYKWDFDFILKWSKRENGTAGAAVIAPSIFTAIERIKFRDVSLGNVQSDGNIYGNRIFVSNVQSFNYSHKPAHTFVELMAY